VVLARGLNYCTAKEVALKLTETCYVVAEPWSTADFMHGPIAAVDEEVPAFLFAPSGPTLPSLRETAQALRERGAERIIFSDDEELLELATVPVRMPPGLPECCSPIIYVVAGQLLAYHLARHKGIDPDQPRGLAKVTRTR
jgi:glucosamine--fructose-6-phosphate aminotransferase (isomerizing)